MYFTKMSEEYFPAVIDLEKQSYPEEMRMGMEGLKEEATQPEFFYYSVAGFSKGELVCYIIAYIPQIYTEYHSKQIYIADVNCPNFQYLPRLLLFFFQQCEKWNRNKKLFHAEMRSTSYHLLDSIDKCKKRGIKIIEDHILHKYYDNGEDAHHVIFSVDLEILEESNWKYGFWRQIDEMPIGGSTYISSVLKFLKKPIQDGVDFHKKNHMKFIMRNMIEKWIDYYSMFGETIPITSDYFLYNRIPEEAKDMDNHEIIHKFFQKALDRYQLFGYKEKKDMRDNEKGYCYDDYRKCLKIYNKGKIYNTSYRNTLSGYRWLERTSREFGEQYFRKYKRTYYVSYFNKFGLYHPMYPVPYITKNLYLFYLDRMLIIDKYLKELDELCENEKEQFISMCETIYHIVSKKYASGCIENIVKRRNKEEGNYFHDWNLIVQTLFGGKMLLTTGAMKAILTKSYNQALNTSKVIEGVCRYLRIEKELQLQPNQKRARKRLSSLIRKNKDCNDYLMELKEHVMEAYSKKLNFSEMEKEMVTDYMQRIQTYCPNVVLYDLFREYGDHNLSKFIRGKYPCLFKAQEIRLSYEGLSSFVKTLLKKQTRQAKHIYRRLKKENLLHTVLEEKLTPVQYREVLEIMKFHNVENLPDELKKLCNFKVLVEAKGSPEYLTAGDATVCCMSYGSIKAKQYALEKGFGIVNVYYKNRVIANSVIWINEPYNCLVLDNIEVHPNYTVYNEILKTCFRTAAEQLMKQYQIGWVVQGTCYNDLILYNDEQDEIIFPMMEPKEVRSKPFYSDAKRSKIVCEKTPNTGFDSLVAASYPFAA